jgi:large subunit ribosomal protein L11
VHVVKRVVTVPLQGERVAATPQFQDALRQLGLNPDTVVKHVQERLRAYAKYPVQKVELEVASPTKYAVRVYLPPVGDLLLKLLGRDVGARDPKSETIGDVPFEQLVEIAVLKRDELKSRTLKAAMKQLLSTCKSMGITVDGKRAGEVIKEVESGARDEILKRYESAWSQQP